MGRDEPQCAVLLFGRDTTYRELPRTRASNTFGACGGGHDSKYDGFVGLRGATESGTLPPPFVSDVCPPTRRHGIPIMETDKRNHEYLFLFSLSLPLSSSQDNLPVHRRKHTLVRR